MAICPPVQEDEVVFSQHIDDLLKQKGCNPSITKRVKKMLEQKPCSISELVKETENNRATISKHLQLLCSVGYAKKIQNTCCYRVAKKDYGIDLDNAAIDRIPEPFFFDIPIIKKWLAKVSNNPSKRYNVTVLQNICYGKIAPDFKINPAKWKHPDATEQFYLAYKQEHSSELQKYVIDALRAFYSNCLKIKLTKDEAASIGLVNNTDGKGKYRYLKLTDEEIAKAERWIESDEALKLCQENNIQIEALKAHWAICLEGFPRPSRVLTIETSAIERKQHEGKEVLHWLQFESKAERLWPKMALDKKRIDWIWNWKQKRAYLKARYLFIDDENYEPKKYDTEELRDIREMYGKIYKELFKHLGKRESVWYDDANYCLRHIGVQIWLSRLGPKGAYIIQQMGWTNFQTFIDHYGSMSPQDLVSVVLSGSF